MFKIIAILLLFNIGAAAGKIDKRLQQYIISYPDHNVKVWIFFRDKGPREQLSFSKEYNRLAEKALQRRSKVSSDVIKFTDYPVNSRYLSQIKAYTLEIRKQSRWLNAVSALIKTDNIPLLADFDCVKEIRLLASAAGRIEKEEAILYRTFVTPEDSLFYGPSQAQLDQIRVTDLHKMGYTGKGITIAMLDDGFNQYDRHIVFDSLNVLDTYDFVNNDHDVTDRDSIPRQGWHGTQTLSVIGGNLPGKLIGAAYKAAFLLAKTESNALEIPQEEDNWVAGLEWAEANGADIISSSVGYIDWYTWEDMDGKTAVTTMATIVAESKGLIIVNSAGNEGDGEAPNTLTAPADGFYVITAGGVNANGAYYGYSSYGPTADGRIKPDVCARAIGVYRASDSNPEGFSLGTGTSFSAPLTAGAIALLLEAFPDLTPLDVREAIRKTASQAFTPDNFLGYGILNIKAAYEYIKNDSLPAQPEMTKAINIPNPFAVYTRIQYAVKQPTVVTLTLYDVSGREVLRFPERIINSDQYEIINGDQLGANGIYFYSIRGKEFQSGKRIAKYGKLLYFK